MCSAFYYLNYLVQLYKLNREGKQIRHAREYIKCAIRTHLQTHRNHTHFHDSDAVSLKKISFLQ